MRPRSIELFEKLFLASIGIGLLNTALSWGVVAKAARSPTLHATGMGEQLVLVSVLIQTLLSLLLWYLVARKGNAIAKWIYVALTAVGLLAMIQALANPATPMGLTLLLSVLALSLQIFAAWLLFKPDAKAWFSGGSADASDQGPIR